MSKVEEFIKNWGYEINKFDKNPFDGIELEKTTRVNDTDKNIEVYDLEEEEVLFIEDDIDDSNDDESEQDE